MTSKQTWVRSGQSLVVAVAMLGLAGCGGTVPPVANSQKTYAPQPPAANATTARTSQSVRPPVLRAQEMGALTLPAVGVAVAARSDGTVFAVGGYDGVASSTAVAQVLPVGQTLPLLPARTHDAAAGFIGPNLYVFGGGQSTSYSTVLRISGKHSTVIGHLPRPLSDAVAIPYTWKGQQGLLLVGGYDGSTFRTNVDFVSEDNGQLNYTRLFNLSEGLRYPAVAVAGQRVYIAGGKDVHDRPVNRVWSWDGGHPTAAAFLFTTLPESVSKAAAFVTPSWLYIAGGWNGKAATSSIYAVNRTSGKVWRDGSLPLTLADMGYAQFGSKGYLAGGLKSESAGGYLRTVYEVLLPRS